ncbi:MAG: RNA 2'-phosphotransferase [Bacteroidota bacterium]
MPKPLSRFLSLLLRHKPDIIGIELDRNGWVDLDELIQKLKAHGRSTDIDQIREVVKTNNKQRFKLDEENRRIRANQGHSIDVDVELSEKVNTEYFNLIKNST